jgi:hypothetical protein
MAALSNLRWNAAATIRALAEPWPSVDRLSPASLHALAPGWIAAQQNSGSDRNSMPKIESG